MDWNQAKERLLAEKHYARVAKGTGLHFNSIRKYAMGLTQPRVDNAQKVIDYLMTHDPIPPKEVAQV